MEHETQSGDRVEHKADEIERFFSLQEIYYTKYVRPAIKEDVKEQFEQCSLPIVEKIKDLNTRLLLKTVLVIIIIVVMMVFIQSS